MEAVRVTRWLKNVGDTVRLGEPLVEVETEKSVVEIEATVSGRLVEILVHVGHEASVGNQIARLESDAAQPASTMAPKPQTPEAEAALASAATFETHAGDRIRSSPAARKLAAEHGVDLVSIAGSGPRGRVQLEDVKKAIESPATARATHTPASVTQGLAPMRRALARAMTLSNATIPQFIVERSVDWTVLQALRAEFSATLAPGSRNLSVNDFLLQAVARVLGEFPAMNSTFWGDPDSPDARLIQASGAPSAQWLPRRPRLLIDVERQPHRTRVARFASRALRVASSASSAARRSMSDLRADSDICDHQSATVGDSAVGGNKIAS
jgi:pyruvate dehydrogenase E2 component (dihydrolipoamide acetyltransferase)